MLTCTIQHRTKVHISFLLIGIHSVPHGGQTVISGATHLDASTAVIVKLNSVWHRFVVPVIAVSCRVASNPFAQLPRNYADGTVGKRLPRREQRYAGAGRRQQIDLDVAASLRRQRYLRLYVLQKVDALAVLHGQQQRFMALGRNGPGSCREIQREWVVKNKHINMALLRLRAYGTQDLRRQNVNGQTKMVHAQNTNACVCDLNVLPNVNDGVTRLMFLVCAATDRNLRVQMRCIDFAALLLGDRFPFARQLHHCGGIH